MAFVIDGLRVTWNKHADTIVLTAPWSASRLVIFPGDLVVARGYFREMVQELYPRDHA